jgi:alkaline phosphatase D
MRWIIVLAVELMSCNEAASDGHKSTNILAPISQLLTSQPIMAINLIMSKLYSLALVLACVLFVSFVASSDPAAPIPSTIHPVKNVRRIIFGSCNNQNHAAPLWEDIINEKPDVFIWLGDIVYSDRSFLGAWRWPNSLENMQKNYIKQFNQHDYTTLRNNGHTEIIGIYDDHDYGENDGDHSYKDKVPSQKLLLDFIQEPETSPRRAQAGIYTSYDYNSEGRIIRVILLDSRYHQNHETGDLLGAEQWKWLENQLNPRKISGEKLPDLVIIGSSIQVIPSERFIGEGWRSFPQSRLKLFQLINKSILSMQNSAFLLLSGDVHYAELTNTFICSADSSAKSKIRVQPLYDLTSSGLTHAVGSQTKHLFDTTAIPLALGTHQLAQPQRSLDINYARIDVDWLEERLLLTVKTVNNAVAFQQSLHLNDLRAQLIDSAEFERIKQENRAQLNSTHYNSAYPVELRDKIMACEYELYRAGFISLNIAGTNVAKLIILGVVVGIISLMLATIHWFFCRARDFAVKTYKAKKAKKSSKQQ